jgi:hypothetical protein
LEVRALGVVEAERTPESVKHGLGRLASAALLEAHIVIDADTGEPGELLAAKAGHPPPAEGG